MIGVESLVLVSPKLIYENLDEPRLRRMFELLEEDKEVQGYLRMSNVMAVDRLLYNDHGPVHSKIAAGSALEIFRILARYVEPTTVKSGLCDLVDAQNVVLCGAYLHDIGNAVHRVSHEIHGCYIAGPILSRLLSKVYPGELNLSIRLKSEILQAIFSHDEEVQCLSVEAGAAKVADGTDMAQGRARKPYKKGKSDIHSLSALSIKKVEIEEGDRKPVKIVVDMDNPSGVFQIQEVLALKIKSSGIEHLIEIEATGRGTIPIL